MLRPPPPPPIEARSFIRVVIAPRQPSFTAPTRKLSGMRTSLKNTSLKAEPPLICLIGRISMPGDSMSTMK